MNGWLEQAQAKSVVEQPVEPMFWRRQVSCTIVSPLFFVFIFR